MAKPIFLAGFDYPNMHYEQITHIQQLLEEKLTDYHVLLYNNNNAKPEFNVLNVADMNPLEYKALIKEVEDIVSVTMQ